MKMATQLMGTVMPVKNYCRKEKARKITDEDRKFNAYTALTQARANAKLFGQREKKAKDAAEAEGKK